MMNLVRKNPEKERGELTTDTLRRQGGKDPERIPPDQTIPHEDEF
jgi:hypothetical protein